MKALHTRSSVEHSFASDAWQRIIYSEFASTLVSAERQFPCVFGSAGFKSDHLRYAFAERLDAPTVAEWLARYLPDARSYGNNTSLVVMERPAAPLPMAEYEHRFWSLLNDLRRLDGHPWPASVPETIDDPLWEFCFHGEPIFVVCNTPAHLMRQSRRSSAFMLTFQPRWVFDGILGTPAAANAAFAKVRAILARYDFVDRSPALGLYGDAGNREAHQYFLTDDGRTAGCPFTSLR